MSKGILVAIEGIDGAGKSTQRGRLEQRLAAAGIDYVATKEPTDGPWGRKIRQSAQTTRMPPRQELEAFVEDRRQHVREVIAPALAAGKVVLVDRYYPSTIAYQGARGLSVEECLQANAFAPVPDVFIVLDIDPTAGLERVHQRGEGVDEFEKQDYLVKVREIFLALELPNKHVLPATLPVDELAERIATLVLDAYAARAGTSR